MDPTKQIGVIVLMQVLPFYDERAIAVLGGVEEVVYQHLRRACLLPPEGGSHSCQCGFRLQPEELARRGNFVV
ncbi:MAG TPA: hypothetical protein VIX63_12870 [Vicinamibacterales bacterium]